MPNSLHNRYAGQGLHTSPAVSHAAWSTLCSSGIFIAWMTPSGQRVPWERSTSKGNCCSDLKYKQEQTCRGLLHVLVQHNLQSLDLNSPSLIYFGKKTFCRSHDSSHSTLQTFSFSLPNSDNWIFRDIHLSQLSDFCTIKSPLHITAMHRFSILIIKNMQRLFLISCFIAFMPHRQLQPYIYHFHMWILRVSFYAKIIKFKLNSKVDNCPRTPRARGLL